MFKEVNSKQFELVLINNNLDISLNVVAGNVVEYFKYPVIEQPFCFTSIDNKFYVLEEGGLQ